jgi:hypothetical protein
VTGPSLEGHHVLVVEKDDARAGRLVMALRALGATAVRWSDDDKGRAQARALRADVVLVDAALAQTWAKPALAVIAAEPALSGATIVRTHQAQLWAGSEPSASVLGEALAAVAPRGERDTKSLRVVATPAPLETPKVVVAPSIAARKIASARKTETYGAVAGSRESSAPPPTNVPIAAIVEAKKPAGYVFPTKKASADIEAETSSKATSLELTAVPSAVLERAKLPDTDRFERAAPRGSWVPWAFGVAVALAVMAVVAALLWG